MIDREGAHCDKCSSFESADFRDFREIVAAIKTDGWLIKKIGNSWFHYCPNCRETIARGTEHKYWWTD